MQLTIAESSERLGVTPRRVRALIERGQLDAVRHGRIWFTTDEAVDSFRRNSPGRGRPISAETAWEKLRAIAADGDLPTLIAARPALRSRTSHRTYALPKLVLRRLGAPKGSFLSGSEALGIRRPGDPLDMYATPKAAEYLVERTGATPHPDGALHLHVLRWPDLPGLDERERLTLAWCDLADRADPAADVAALRLWPDSIQVPQLAEVVRGRDAVDHIALRGFTDWLQRHPQFVGDAIGARPGPSEDPVLDSIYAAIAETAAGDAGIEPPAWALETPATSAPIGSGQGESDVPPAFRQRGIPIERSTFWHQ